jgi:hypothetical protein
VLLGLLAAALVGALAWFLAGDPVRTVRDTWAGWTADLEAVPDVHAEPVPEGSVAPPFAAVAVVDRDPRTAWATTWRANTPAAPVCGGSTAGRLELSWSPAVRVVRIDLRAGLSADEDRRGHQFLPARVDVEIGGVCEEVELGPSPDWQEHTVEFEGEVDSVTLSVADVHTNQENPVEELVAISWVRVMAQDG